METSNGSAMVCFEPDEACARCDSHGLCQAAGSRHLIAARNPVGARVNDRVYVEQTAGAMLLSAGLLFGLPVALAVTGLVAAGRIHETAAAIAGVVGFVLGLAIAKSVNDRIARSGALQPSITEILAEEGP